MTVEEAREDLMLAQADVSYRPKDDSFDMAIIALKQKTGHWIDCAERELWYRCSECGERVCGSYYRYCPNCGAKMER